MYGRRSARFRCFTQELLAGFQERTSKRQKCTVSPSHQVASPVTFTVRLPAGILL